MRRERIRRGTDTPSEKGDPAAHDEGCAATGDLRDEFGRHGAADGGVERRIVHGRCCDRHRRTGQLLLLDQLVDVVFTEQGRQDRVAYAGVAEVVAAQVRDHRDQMRLQQRQTGHVRRDGHRDRDAAADVRGESLGPGVADVVGDRDVDRVLDITTGFDQSGVGRRCCRLDRPVSVDCSLEELAYVPGCHLGRDLLPEGYDTLRSHPPDTHGFPSCVLRRQAYRGAEIPRIGSRWGRVPGHPARAAFSSVDAHSPSRCGSLLGEWGTSRPPHGWGTDRVPRPAPYPAPLSAESLKVTRVSPVPDLPPSQWTFDPVRWPFDDCVAAGADLEPATILGAYTHGAFPMPIEEIGPMLWWSPLARGVLRLEHAHVSRSLRRSLKRFTITVDRSFVDVIDACADPNRPGAWIDSRIRDAYVRLHRLGWAHSIEARTRDGALAGGLYGLAIGGLFAGESMFHHVRA